MDRLLNDKKCLRMLHAAEAKDTLVSTVLGETAAASRCIHGSLYSFDLP
jgi:hypothetical protein